MDRPGFGLDVADLGSHACCGGDLGPRRTKQALHALPEALVAEHDEQADDEAEQSQNNHRIAVERLGDLLDNDLQAAKHCAGTRSEGGCLAGAASATCRPRY